MLRCAAQIASSPEAATALVGVKKPLLEAATAHSGPKEVAPVREAALKVRFCHVGFCHCRVLPLCRAQFFWPGVLQGLRKVWVIGKTLVDGITL